MIADFIQVTPPTEYNIWRVFQLGLIEAETAANLLKKLPKR